MRFLCTKATIQDAISIAQKAVLGKSPMQILEGILIKAFNNEITLIGSDIDLSIETKVAAEIIEPGSIVVDSKLFGDIIRKLPNDIVEIKTIDNNSIEITCQKSSFTLIHMNADDFPSLPAISENMLLQVPQKTLKNMIRSTIFSVAQDETRPILTGILFEIKDRKLSLVALDGYRLALKNENVENDNTINAVIPGKTLNEIVKILEDKDLLVNITFTPNHILFNLGETKVISRLLEGEFIKYSSIIPEEFNTKVTVKREELLDCIERASLMAKDGNTNLIRFDIADDAIVITSNSQLGKVREEQNILLKGSPLKIAFNSRYLIDILKTMEDEEVVMNFSSNISPCVIKNTENDNCTYLVLPVRLIGN